MTATMERTGAAGVVEDFFDAYRSHDTLGMVELCTDTADFSYVPVEIWGKQRVIRGDGKVATLGRPMWEGLINSFPDLSNEVHSITASEEGQVAAVVSVGGTQEKAWGPIAPTGRKYWEPHVFIFDVNGDDKIESITAYWDNAGIYRQLGHMEVD